VKNYLDRFYDNVTQGAPHEAFKNNAIENEDKVKLPLISFFRSEIALDPTNFALFKRGRATHVTRKDAIDTIHRERILKFQLSYTIDVWATNPDQAIGLFSELLFSIMDEPGVPVIHDGIVDPLVNYLRVTDIMDNTDTASIASRGRLSRFSIVFQLSAHIAKLEKSDRILIVPEFYTFWNGELTKIEGGKG
jgi:hypothetical protein